MRNKIIVGLIIFAVLAVGLILYLREKSTVLYAESESKQWSACVIRDYGDPKNTWVGNVFYKGGKEPPKEIILTAILDGYLVHDKEQCEFGDPSNYSLEQRVVLNEDFKTIYPFMSYYTEKPKKVELTIQWHEDGKVKKEHILLQ